MTYSSLKKLDNILEILAKNEDNSQKLNVAKLVLITNYNLGDVLFVLNKLIKDKFVITSSYEGLGEIMPFTNEMYSITFEGLVFYESGGYQTKIDLDKANEKRIIRNERLLVNGTWFAGIAAILLLAWQIIVYFLTKCK